MRPAGRLARTTGGPDTTRTSKAPTRGSVRVDFRIRMNSRSSCSCSTSELRLFDFHARSDDGGLRARGRACLAVAVDQHGSDFVLAAGHIGKFQLERRRGFIAIQLQIAAAIEVLGV